MLFRIAGFEMRYVARNPLLWLLIVAVSLMLVAGMSIDGFDLGNEGGLLKNAAYANIKNYASMSVFCMLVTTAFVANAVLRDDQTGYGPIIRSTGITKFDYVLGRFLGAFAIAAIALLVVPVATVLGTLMPWAPADQLGPNRLADHLFGYFVVSLPNLFVQGAVFFALATITRSMMATYLGVLSFVAAFIIFDTGFVGNIAVAVADPFGRRALKDAVRYWTVAERNVNLPDVAGGLLFNRLCWISVGVLALTIACTIFRFADRGISRRERKQLKLASAAAVLEEAQSVGDTVAIPDPQHDSRARWALLWMRVKFEAKQVVLSPAFVIVLAWGMFTTFYALTTRGSSARPSFPTTLTLIPEIAESFTIILLVIAIFYAGELVWRERDRRVHEIIDATPLPNWAYVVPKTIAMALVLVAIVMVNVGAAIGYQLSLGYTNVEISKYLLWYALPASWDVMLLAVFAIFVQSISAHKTIGWAIMVAFIVWKQFNQAIDHNLLNYASSPGMPLSDMNGAGSFWIGAWSVRLYWGAFAALLLVGAHLLWRRGTAVRLKPRLAAAPRRLRGATGWVAIAALLVFIASGAWAFYNINILNHYHSPLAGIMQSVERERNYWKYHDIAQPSVDSIVVSIDLFPEERRAMTKGRYVLRNLTSQSINEVHVRLLYDDLELVNASLDNAELTLDDRELNYFIHRLSSPMQPGETRVFTFETRRWQRGFRNGAPNTRLVENGTFLNNHELTPAIGGMTLNELMLDPAGRRYYNLPEINGRAKLEDLGAMAQSNPPGGWMSSAEITISTAADQTPLAPGRRISDVVNGDRRIACFVSEAPMRDKFSVQSARYAEKRRQHRGVDLAVYYHEAHPWNVDRMLDALAASLDYFEESFGPYQFDHMRIVEYPGYANNAQAFAGTVPYSETYGFIADLSRPWTIDHVTATTAHELAHQWWAHQITGADMEGSMVLSETLANYSALMMMRHLRGEAEIRRMLRYTLNQYLAYRASGGLLKERPLARVETENWIGYQKGALAMYLIQKRIGEDAVNRALKNLLARYRFRNAPYPRSLELVEALRAEARTEEDQNLITDLFERVVLYDLRVAAPTATQRADGKWDVTVPVNASKYVVDEKGRENETALDEHIEVGLFAEEPGYHAFRSKDVIVLERKPIRSGIQTLRFVADRKPTYAGVDPYNYYIDRVSGDNVVEVLSSGSNSMAQKTEPTQSYPSKR